jgi:membrane protease YdiL (CAAX protease family)
MMVNRISKYFNNTKDYKPSRFILEMFLIIFALQILFVVTPSLAENVFNVKLHVNFDDREILLNRYHWLTAFLIACLIVPFIETVFAQAIPITLICKITNNTFLIIFISATIFTLLHKSYPSLYLSFIFISGIIYAWSYNIQKNKGCVSALLITTIIHGLANFIPYLHIQLF